MLRTEVLLSPLFGDDPTNCPTVGTSFCAWWSRSKRRARTLAGPPFRPRLRILSPTQGKALGRDGTSDFLRESVVSTFDIGHPSFHFSHHHCVAG
jgi:hypothetical protein